MDFVEYDRAKFELADVLRSASLKARAVRPQELYPFEDLFARLADDRFNVVVVGQFSRGKTSLMNAMLNTERLPTGIVPLTSVITTVQYGATARAVLEYDENRLPRDVSLDSLADFITQRNNPGNVQGIRFARIELPSDILRRGLYLVDTPGLGSAIVENTRTTQGFLPEADALILVTSYDSPLSDEELGVLQSWATRGCRVFVVINKQDLAPSAEREEVREHVLAQLRTGGDQPLIEVFSLSARDAIAANKSRDKSQWIASGVPAFMDVLTRFLVDEKQSAFLQRMADRIADRLADLGDCSAELDQLARVQSRLGVPTSARAEQISALGEATVRRFTTCFICSCIEHEVHDFLRQYQYQISINAQVQRELADGGGLCPFHTWQYAAIASPHGTCAGFPAVLERYVEALRNLEQNPAKLLPDASDPDCALCRVQARAEASAVVKAARLVEAAANDREAKFPTVCLYHLRRTVKSISVPAAARSFLGHQAEAWMRVAEDMRRYALKRDGSRRALTTDDELDAHRRGLVALAGHETVKFSRMPSPDRDGPDQHE